MKKETVYSILRHLLSAVGAYLLGKTFFGQTVDDTFVQTATGVVLTVVGIVWSIVDKTASIEMLQGAIRQVVTFVGGLFIAAGKLTPEKIETYLGIITFLLPIVYSWLSRKKTQALSDSSSPLTLRDLKK